VTAAAVVPCCCCHQRGFRGRDDLYPSQKLKAPFGGIQQHDSPVFRTTCSPLFSRNFRPVSAANGRVQTLSLYKIGTHHGQIKAKAQRTRWNDGDSRTATLFTSHGAQKPRNGRTESASGAGGIYYRCLLGIAISDQLLISIESLAEGLYKGKLGLSRAYQ